MIGALTFAIVNQASAVWMRSRASLVAFEGARVGFEYLTRQLQQATLGTYWDYDDPQQPTRYQRRSELHFLMGNAGTITGAGNALSQAVFFQAPLGFTRQRGESGGKDYRPLRSILSAVGFYVQFGSQQDLPPFLKDTLPERYRFRLMYFREPSEKLSLYAERNTDGSPSPSWLRGNLEEYSSPIAENVVALIFRAKYPNGSQGTAESYQYDSAFKDGSATYNQLPPVITITMVVIDEASAVRLQALNGSSLPDLKIDSLFSESGEIPDGKYKSDLQVLEERLQQSSIPLNYRIFSADVAVRGAKWSR